MHVRITVDTFPLGFYIHLESDSMIGLMCLSSERAAFCQSSLASHWLAQHCGAAYT